MRNFQFLMHEKCLSLNKKNKRRKKLKSQLQISFPYWFFHHCKPFVCFVCCCCCVSDYSHDPNMSVSFNLYTSLFSVSILDYEWTILLLMERISFIFHFMPIWQMKKSCHIMWEISTLIPPSFNILLHLFILLCVYMHSSIIIKTILRLWGKYNTHIK
jgi:hypothetical protein